MSDEKFDKDEPERTLVTLDQLSQTIEVMTSVVNRLRSHLAEQIKAQLGDEAESLQNQINAQSHDEVATSQVKRESFVVEINQQETISHSKNDKTLH